MDLDNYYSLDESISILLLKPLDLEAEDAATSSTIRPSTKAALEDDDYEDDDDYDEDIDDDDDDDDDGRKKVIAKKSRERISHEDYIDDDVKDYDDDDDDDDEEDDEDEKTLDEEEDKKKKGKGLNGGNVPNTETRFIMKNSHCCVEEQGKCLAERLLSPSDINYLDNR